ncbi:Major facilitator superfamily domain, general substrate transporter [Lecanosticta acicola]|uniref:Major facilitator superfamily domain, general substrate transporter n=1 Tax=Lecanosticta acicola TaxID=111012 RepID=A0AAI9E5N6_9PEZI|nr:Major facilitator superfamily domain, general substrate transporter [Lecanosticta acicola]
MAVIQSLRNLKHEFSRELTWPLVLVTFYASLAGMSYGIDLNYWSGLLGLAQFQKDFGVYDASTQSWIIPTVWQSVGSGTPTAGIAVGTLIAGWLGNRFGRIKAFWVAAGIALVGILVQSTAGVGEGRGGERGYWQLIVGRIVNALSMGIICNIIPIYQSEVAPAKLRGSFVNSYQFMLLFGGLFAVIVNWALSERTDQWAYRVILIVQLVIPTIMVVGGFILPESPRWLISKGRDEEAVRVLKFLRRGTADAVVEKEVQLIARSVEEQRFVLTRTGWIDCFRGPNLRRTLIAVGVQCLQPAQGNSYMTTYSIVLFQAIGITDEYKTLIYLYFLDLVADGCAFIVADKMGRRPLMFTSSILVAASLYTVGGLTGYADSTNPAVQKGTLAAIFLWYFIDAVGWAGCVWITCAEAPTTILRERTMTIATFSGFVVNLLIQYVSPYLQDEGYANLQGKIGFVWGSFAIVAAVWVALFLPEMSGRSLEELDELFEKGVSVWKFKNFTTVGVGAEVRELEDAGKEAVLDEKKVIVGVEVEPVEMGDECEMDSKKKMDV